MKAEDYNLAIAEHYKAYRPPLHEVILGQCLEPGIKFSRGLDVGSGTGQSTLALAAYCETVTGIEPSDEMRKKATEQTGVSYLASDGKTLPVHDHQYDIISFAGSWFYAKSQMMVEEVVRVAAAEAIVIIYDFEILFSKLSYGFGLPKESEQYDHRANFSEFDTPALHTLGGFSTEITMKASSEEMCHLLLSAKSFYQYFLEKYNGAEVYHALLSDLKKFPGKHNLQARLYATIYAAH